MRRRHFTTGIRHRRRAVDGSRRSFTAARSKSTPRVPRARCTVARSKATQHAATGTSFSGTSLSRWTRCSAPSVPPRWRTQTVSTTSELPTHNLHVWELCCELTLSKCFAGLPRFPSDAAAFDGAGWRPDYGRKGVASAECPAERDHEHARGGFGLSSWIGGARQHLKAPRSVAEIRCQGGFPVIPITERSESSVYDRSVYNCAPHSTPLYSASHMPDFPWKAKVMRKDAALPLRPLESPRLVRASALAGKTVGASLYSNYKVYHFQLHNSTLKNRINTTVIDRGIRRRGRR